MGGAVIEPELPLAGAHLVGERPSPGTTTMGRGLDAMASSQACSSGERTTLPPSFATMGRNRSATPHS